MVWSTSHSLQVDQFISLVVEARGEHMVGGIGEPCCGQQTRDLDPLVSGCVGRFATYTIPPT